MKKIGFVSPWYGADIPGGAETELRGIVKHLKKAGAELEVLTTCVQQFSSDWNQDYYREGLEDVDGIQVRRFKVRKRNTKRFDAINAKLIRGQQITRAEEEEFMREMVNSEDLYDYIREYQDDYSLFVYIPYMFGTTYYGIKACPQKAVVIPCFHEESYIHMSVFRDVFEQAAGFIYLSEPEKELANRVFDLSNAYQEVLGAGVDTEFDSDPDHFREKFNIENPFILYAGRKDEGKNIYLLLKYYEMYIRRHPESSLELVLIGGGEVRLPESVRDRIHDLGFVDLQDKHDACAASAFMCMPSVHESFSIVIMESWLGKRPVLVHGDCGVTKNFVITTNGGLYFNDYFEFEGCTDYFLEHPDVCEGMGENGRAYVLENFSWDAIVRKLNHFFDMTVEGGSDGNGR